MRKVCRHVDAERLPVRVVASGINVSTKAIARLKAFQDGFCEKFVDALHLRAASRRESQSFLRRIKIL
ncbi:MULTISPECIES: hypothetical protein [Fischerella]|uniref:hypothetical protein n=1 Tax=Fischerella TaxID=1190 RepID=UPI0011AF799D|nr:MULTISPECIES: hypothetical protein [Fischerella]